MRGPHQQIRRRFGRGVGAVGRKGSIFPETAFRTQSAVDFVGRDMHHAGRTRLPRAVQQNLGAQDVGGDEGRGVCDRAIDVTFRRKVHNGVGFFVRKQR